MSPDMSPLERRYRRLLRLLPATHRTARGEELLGLLLDLDDGRRHPSRHETLNIIALAIRLRLTTPVTTVALTTALSALLVAAGTQPAGQTLDLFTGAVLATDMPAIIAGWPQIVALGLLPLAPLIAWLCGATRTALTLQAIFLTVTVGWFVIEMLNGADVGINNPGQQLFSYAAPVLTLVLLAIAARERWTFPGRACSGGPSSRSGSSPGKAPGNGDATASTFPRPCRRSSGSSPPAPSLSEPPSRSAATGPQSSSASDSPAFSPAGSSPTRCSPTRRCGTSTVSRYHWRSSSRRPLSP